MPSSGGIHNDMGIEIDLDIRMDIQVMDMNLKNINKRKKEAETETDRGTNIDILRLPLGTLYVYYRYVSAEYFQQTHTYNRVSYRILPYHTIEDMSWISGCDCECKIYIFIGDEN